MSELTRRDLLRQAAAAVTVLGAIDVPAARAVHELASQARAGSGGVYTPKAFTAHEYATLDRLTDLIIPVEEGAPGARAAGAAAWIDMLAAENAQLAAIFTGGLAWIDRAMRRRGAADFVSAPAAAQTALLDVIAFRKNDSPELGPGIRFFDWARRLTVDAFYTSEIGIKDIDYRGNRPSAAFEVPAASIDFALRKRGSA